VSLARVARVLRLMESMSSGIAVLAFISMVVITVVDATLRYALNSPLSWSFTVIANYLMAATFVLGVSEMQRLQGHITMEFVRSRLSDRAYTAVLAIVDVLGCAFCLLLAAANFPLFVTALMEDERVPSAMSWPLWPSYLILPIGFGLAALRFAVQAAQACIAISSGQSLKRPAPGIAEGVE
jgi:C4-dicarboxylate transporter DctQ subunit